MVVPIKEPLVASLLLVAMSFAPGSFLLLVVMPGAPSSDAPAPNSRLFLVASCSRWIVFGEVNWGGGPIERYGSSFGRLFSSIRRVE